MTKPSKNSKTVSATPTDVISQRDDSTDRRSARILWDGRFPNVPRISEIVGSLQDPLAPSLVCSLMVYDSKYGNHVTDDPWITFWGSNSGEPQYTGGTYPISQLSWAHRAISKVTSNGFARQVLNISYINQVPNPLALSPDYVAGYVNAYPSDMAHTWFTPDNLPYYAQFEGRFWVRNAAIISAHQGDGQYVKPNGVFQTPLSVKITDSLGSMEATHNKVVWFQIKGSILASFDATGDNQAALEGNLVRTAKVWCQNGIATAPRIKAGGQPGDVIVTVSTNASAGDYSFVLKISDEDASSDVAYCTPWLHDHQDVIAGNAFPDNLVAQALTTFHTAATTDSVRFSVFLSPIAGQMARVLFPGGALTNDKNVEDGFATADPLVSTTINEFGPAGYATAYVYAYPLAYADHDPRNDTSGKVATFIQRVWTDRVAKLSIENGDQQKQAAGLIFDQRLGVKVLGQDQLGVDNLAVTFDLAGYAEFILGDSVPVISWTPTSVTVATNQLGIATAPGIRATADKHGTITVTASSAVSNSQPFTLTSEIPAGTTTGLQKASGDLQDQHINENFPFDLGVIAQAANGPAQSGQIIFTAVPDAATGVFRADPTNPNKQTTTTTANVHDGSAVAPATLVATGVTNAKQYSGYFTVTASGPYVSYPATFKERVWRDKNVMLSQDSNTPENGPAIETFPFRYPVAVQAKDPSLNPIDDLLVTFSINGPATFEYDALSGQQGTATAAMVYTRNGIATSPPILAGNTAASVFITADANVAAAPVTFQLEVLEGDTAAYYTYATDGDKQDQKTNGAFPIPLTVAAKTQNGNQPATTGEVWFEIEAGTATASFSGVSGSKTKVKVVNGTAKAPPVIAGTTTTADAGTVTVYAYPASYSGDPKIDRVASQVSQFTLNVWPDDYVVLLPGGSDQQTDMGKNFPTRLTASPANKHEEYEPLPDYLVTFKVTDGPAVFDPDDDPGDVVSRPNERTVVVRSNWQGIATAPYLKAGDSGGPVSVVASDAMGNTATYPNLTVHDPAPPLYILSALDSPISVPVNGSNNASFQLKPFNNSGAQIEGIAISLALQNGSNTQLSFSPTTLLMTTSATTNSQGVASVKIYGGPRAGNGSVFANQSQASVDSSIPADVQVYLG